MIVCKLNHRCSLSIDGDRFRIMGFSPTGNIVDESGRWMQGPCGPARGAVNLRENVVHVWTIEGAVYEFNGEGDGLSISRIGAP